MIALEDAAIGTLLGLACGDALGGAVEFRSRHDLDSAFPDGIREIMGGGPHRLEIGEYTDDTAMALAIARACSPAGIDLDAVASNFVAWYRSGPKDIGIATSQALRLIASGTPWQEAGEQLNAASREGVAGNGTVMRCAPIALRFRSDPNRMRWASMETSRMTHADSRATWGAVALNQAIVHLLDGGEKAGLVEAAVQGIEDRRVIDTIRSAHPRGRGEVTSGGYVLDTLGAAFWCILGTTSAEDAVCQAVELGWDTDTTGAVTGALAGALYGESGLPHRWLKVIHDRAELTSLALGLLEMDGLGA